MIAIQDVHVALMMAYEAMPVGQTIVVEKDDDGLVVSTWSEDPRIQTTTYVRIEDMQPVAMPKMQDIFERPQY